MWALNGEECWKVGYSSEHYGCIKVFFPKTRSERDCDTITFFPIVVPYTKVYLDDFLRQAATDIITILTIPPSSTTPSLQVGYVTKNSLLNVAKSLNRAEDLPSPHSQNITTAPQRAPKLVGKQLPTSKIIEIVKANISQTSDVNMNKKEKLNWQKG